MLALRGCQRALQVQHGLVLDADKQPPVVKCMPNEPHTRGATNGPPDVSRNGGLALRPNNRFTHMYPALSRFHAPSGYHLSLKFPICRFNFGLLSNCRKPQWVPPSSCSDVSGPWQLPPPFPDSGVTSGSSTARQICCVRGKHSCFQLQWVQMQVIIAHYSGRC